MNEIRYLHNQTENEIGRDFVKSLFYNFNSPENKYLIIGIPTTCLKHSQVLVQAALAICGLGIRGFDNSWA